MFVYILEKHLVISGVLSLCGMGHRTFHEGAKSDKSKQFTAEGVRFRQSSLLA